MRRSWWIVVLCLQSSIFHFQSSMCHANDFGYTEEHPLVIVSDWDFRPFEFVNVEGKPAGYNVNVLNMILDQLDIPHKFVMQEWHVATGMFKRREADLIHAPYSFYKDSPYVSTQKFINYYNLKVARRADMEPLHQLSELQPTDTLMMKEDGYAAMIFAEMDTVPFTMEFSSPKNGLAGIRQGIYKYYIWGETPLKYKIQELGLDSIALDEIDIPTGELRIIGYNEELIDLIDDQYTRLEQAGELQNIYDHWFHPERQHDDESPVALFIVGGLLLATVIVYLLIRLVRQRVRMAVRESSDLGQMMDQVLNMGDYFVLEWDFEINMLRNKYGNMLPDGGMRPEDFLKHMPQEEATQLHSLNAQLATGVISHFDLSFTFNQGTQEQPIWRNYYGNGIGEMEKSSKQTDDQFPKRPHHLLYTIKDITEEVNEERRITTNASKYKKMFDTNLVAMSFYDADGHLLDLNQKMRELCQLPLTQLGGDGEEPEQFVHNTLLFSFPNLQGVYLPGSREVMYVCQHLDEPQLGLNKYIEFRIKPVINDDDELVYYIITCRDITAERNMYLEQRKHDQQLQTVNEAVKRYEQQLGYLLEESSIYIWSYIPAKNVVNLTRTPGQTEFTETIEEYLLSVNADSRQQAMAEIQSAMQQGKPYNTILLFDRTPLDFKPTWYAVSGIPMFNKDGQLTEYFGLSRDITELMDAQEKLRIETARAKDSGQLKAAFLANMTHEIRTPLNAIVGFSDLLPMIEDASEKKEFMRIIRNNCDMLLRLISDILEASNLNSQLSTLKPTDIDFAQAFDDICQTLEQRVQEPGVKFIKDNPYKTFKTRLDKGRIQQVITNFVINAVKYTKQGHIKVGWRTSPDPSKGGEIIPPSPDPSKGGEIIPPSPGPSKGGERLVSGLPPSFGGVGGGLYIYCEDTGAGIPEEKQDSVFERFVKLNEFVQGTGLGLNICKSIAERCGGSIGVHSKGKGKGSTFWIWIPCTQQYGKTTD
ncbi:MAG: transporter substrate-binding domain-containing protein [Prevotella sp.]|nr:transporter substrate-binding domain-containing protein [Prevotella sp.]